MEVVRKSEEIKAWVRKQKASGKKVSLVPTMGALHAGHLSLVSIAKAHSDAVILYIFVNPAQFNDPKDLEKYPRTLERDLELARGENVDVVFAPEAADIYPEGGGKLSGTCHVRAGNRSENFEGDGRPGHFDGVCTVLNIMFNIVEADTAVFGEKDYQQLQVVSQMVKDLQIPIEIIPAPLVRDHDGLALSSRNVRLSPEGRKESLVISRTLAAAAEKVSSGERDARKLEQNAIQAVESTGRVKVEYASIVDADSLEPLSHIDKPCQFLLTATVEGIRLLDNIRLKP
ncbi:MAG: pantoate--beta-alanine ligase [Bdellovibrionales bacterium]|nr:pantoate--beta-alanine ligase [Bdellovibrionales bacterium]